MVDKSVDSAGVRRENEGSRTGTTDARSEPSRSVTLAADGGTDPSAH